MHIGYRLGTRTLFDDSATTTSEIELCKLRDLEYKPFQNRRYLSIQIRVMKFCAKVIRDPLVVTSRKWPLFIERHAHSYALFRGT